MGSITAFIDTCLYIEKPRCSGERVAGSINRGGTLGAGGSAGTGSEHLAASVNLGGITFSESGNVAIAYPSRSVFQHYIILLSQQQYLREERATIV
jgi:hypothetical protein